MASISAPLGVHSDLVTLRSLAETVTKFSVIWILQLPVIPLSAVCVIFTPSAHHYLPPYHIRLVSFADDVVKGTYIT